MPVFSHMLIPLDGSRLAEAVLPTALDLASGLKTRVTLLHVLERDAPSTRHGDPHLTDAQSAGHYLAGLAESYAGTGLQIDYHVHDNPENDVAASIASHVYELGADIVALTPHGRPDLRRWLVGSIPQIVLQRSSIPALFVPPGATNKAHDLEIRSVLVPIEGHGAEDVLGVAQQLSAALGAEVYVVQVVPTLGTVRGENLATAIFSPVSTAATLDLEEQAAQANLAAYLQSWTAEKRPSVAVLRGEPVQVLLDTVNQLSPDLILMSTHGKSGLAGVWSASVAARIVGRSPRPVLLLPVQSQQAPS
ncbi:MAG: universal stress protein [Chloroflexota bacterium]|nr:universal stress protein [Chloroflexota bacterium]